MKRYEPAAPRAALGMAAMAIAATTFGVFVVLPAQLEAVDNRAYAMTTAAVRQHNATATPCSLNREEGS
jgi:hypothetical protein